MAHAARSLELVQGLIISITGKNATNTQCTRVIKGLREHNFARTNQFAVKARLDGLIEKFSVLGRDELADALQLRLDKLQTDDRFLPDKLALFLELSDLPHRKIDLAVLDDIAEPSVAAAEDITWAQIIKDDPLEEDIWDDIGNGYHSSGDESDSAAARPGSDSSDATAQTSVDDDVTSLAHAHLSQPYVSEPNIKATSTTRLTELRLIRETLFMLRGLSPDLFTLDRNDGRVYFSTNAVLELATPSTTKALIDHASDLGSTLNSLRAWSRSPQYAPHIRSCQAAVHQLLCTLDHDLCMLERSFVESRERSIVSMLQLCSYLDDRTRALQQLIKPLRRASDSDENAAVVLLEGLYDSACTAHHMGDHEVFELLLNVFLAGTKTFLRPITRWCLSDELDSDETNPLVVDKDVLCPASAIWHDRYALRKVDSHELPSFLDRYAERLFAVGKTRLFRSMLGHDSTAPPAVSVTPEVHLRLLNASNDFISFSQQLDCALRSWVASLEQSSALNLPEVLLDEHRLLDRVDAIEHMFLHKDGSAFSHFTEALYDQVYSAHQSRPNEFMLTEMARESFISLPTISVDDIVIRVSYDHASRGRCLRALGSLELHLTLPWFMTNIMRRLTTQQRVFAILVQLDIAKRLLQQNISSRRQCPSGRVGSADLRMHCLQLALISFIDIVNAQITLASKELSARLKHSLEQSRGLDDMIESYLLFEHNLGILTMTHSRLKSLSDGIVDVLILAEVLAEFKRQTNLSNGDTRRIDDLCGKYQRQLRHVLIMLREEAEKEDAEALENVAEVLSACLLRESRVVVHA